MTDKAVAAIARAAGIAPRWTDAFGTPRTVTPDTLRAMLGALGLQAATDQQIRASRAMLKAMAVPGALPPLVTAESGRAIDLPAIDTRSKRYRIVCEDGSTIEGSIAGEAGGHITLPPIEAHGYHRLSLGEQVTTLAVAPRRCFGVADLEGPRSAWGSAAQLYSLRRTEGGGVGDYPSLGLLARGLAEAGADALAVSPVHAMFGNDPAHCSPYAPSSRLFLNALHVDAVGLCGMASLAPDREALRILRQAEEAALIDWPAVALARMALMRDAFSALVQRGLLSPDTPTGQAFAAFRRERGESLERHARFEALQAHLLRADKAHWHWRSWPAGFRDPGSVDVAAFARDANLDVAFHAFLQWRAAVELADAQAIARTSGMRIGLILDLAIGTDSGGSHAWGHQSEILSSLSVGAPPDLLNPLGQAWGLATFSPHALVRTGYRPFLDMLRAAMRYGGGVRIDHILGLQRLWLVPNGASALDGAYLRYPLQDLLRLIALESWRHRTLVIGEDLGTVPAGFRATLRNAGILGTRVLWFERNDQGFIPPAKWPGAAMATSSTHDLPTIAGWWTGRDIEWRIRLALLGEHETPEGLAVARADDRRALWRALREAGVAEGDAPPHDDPGRVLDAVAALIGRTACDLALLPLEDVLGLVEQPNLPGTVDTHPNWRRRLPVTVEHLAADPAVRARLQALSRRDGAP